MPEAFHARFPVSVKSLNPLRRSCRKKAKNGGKREGERARKQLAYEQALLFGRASCEAARGLGKEFLFPGPRVRVSSRASTFHDILQMESLLAG